MKKLFISIISLLFFTTISFAGIERYSEFTEQEKENFKECISKAAENIRNKPTLDYYKSIFDEDIDLSVINNYNWVMATALKLTLDKGTGMLDILGTGPDVPIIVPDKYYYWKNEIKEVRMVHPDGEIKIHKIKIYYNYSVSCDKRLDNVEDVLGSVAEVYYDDGRFMSLLIGVAKGFYVVIPYSMS